MLARIAENVVLFAVSMKVKTCLNLRSLRVILDLSFDFIYLWMEYLRGLFPPSIQINTSDVASEVSIDNSINVDHWIYLDDAVLENMLDLRSLFEKTVHYS